MWHTKLAERMGIKFPIIQAPMAGGATTPELVAAVCNAGGLGSLGAGYMTPTEIRSAIRKIRELTNQPFAVNLFIPQGHHATLSQLQQAYLDIKQSCFELNLEIDSLIEPYAPPYAEQISVLLEEKIPIFSYVFGILDLVKIDQFKRNHTLLIGTATNLTEAQELEKSGIDAIVAQGGEAGGHRGTFLGKAEDSLLELSRLLPQLVQEIKLPIIAAGGIMDGKGIVAAADLGAEAVQMGTAFLTCSESGIAEGYKQTLLTQEKDNTVLTRAFSGKLARGIHNKFIKRMEEKELNILDYPIQNFLTTAMRKKAKEKQNIDFMALWAGQSAALCRNTNASELIKALVFEVEASKLNH